MSRLVLTAELLSSLRADLLKGDEESCAVLIGRTVEIAGRLARIVVRECVKPPSNSYAVRTSVRAQLQPEFVALIGQRARLSGESVVFVHTHPVSFNEFSEIDDSGEEKLAAFLRQRASQAKHAAMLLTPEKSIARELGQKRPLRVIGVGTNVTWGDDVSDSEIHAQYDRQVRAFGVAGQRILRSIRVGIVGLGGTGSIVLQALAHLGVQDFVLLDPDIVEETNLNRLVGARPKDLGLSKVSVAKAWAQQINPDVRIEACQDSVIRAAVARSLADTDFVFCCTDSHGSRAILNQLAYQSLVPAIDMGVVIAAQEKHITHVAGRTQLLAPGVACMVCGNLLDPEEIRRDLLTDFERQADPYILGHPEPAPAVISLNSTIASLATTMFLNTVTGIPGSARFLNYNAITGVCRPAACTPHPSCIVCSSSGALARADEWPLPARQD
jgi:proteasome lid subunit RPN8/RPN11